MTIDPLLESLERTAREGPDAETRLAAATLAKARRERLANSPARCAKHPAYDADYCPGCGTSRVIGGPPEGSPLVAWNREESEPCQKGTVGCSVQHKADGPEQECLPW